MVKKLIQMAYDFEQKQGKKAIGIYLGADEWDILIHDPEARMWFYQNGPIVNARPEIDGVPVYRIFAQTHLNIG
ncbi:MAG: hypothetical protein AABZ15_11730 [Nitrospirota bacterium]